jgi:hypothetical protein
MLSLVTLKKGIMDYESKLWISISNFSWTSINWTVYSTYFTIETI